MNKYIFILCILALLVPSGLAQDWQLDDDDDGSGDQYNCDLVRAVVDNYGDEEIMQTSRNTYASVASLFDTFFPKCFDRGAADEAPSVDAGATESESDEAADAITILEGNDLVRFTDECTVMLADEMGNGISLSVAGDMQDVVSAIAYLPGETVPADIDDVFTDTVASMEVRIEHVDIDPVPMGRYTFDVQVRDELHRFQWLRSELDDATLLVICTADDEDAPAADDAVDDADDSPVASSTRPTAPDDLEVTAILENDDIHAIDADCSIFVTDRFDVDFNVTIVGRGQESLFVDVYLPGESERALIEDVTEDTMDGIPMRIEWVDGRDFPTGTYTVDVFIGDASHRFQWERGDDTGYTVVMSCLRLQDLEDDSDLLDDGDSSAIGDTNCTLVVDSWSTDLNVVIVGQDHETVEIDLYYPGDTQPRDMSQVSRDEFDDGTPYRVEWIVGDSFPTGEYGVTAHVDGRSHLFTWNRQDPDYNTIYIRCRSDEEEGNADS